MITRLLASLVGLVAIGIGLLVATRVIGRPWRELDGKQRERVLLWVIVFAAMPAIATVVTLSLTDAS